MRGSIKSCGTHQAGTGGHLGGRKAPSRGAVEYMNPYGQEGLDGVEVPTHRPLLIPAGGHHLVDGRFREGRPRSAGLAGSVSRHGQESGKDRGSGGARSRSTGIRKLSIKRRARHDGSGSIGPWPARERGWGIVALSQAEVYPDVRPRSAWSARTSSARVPIHRAKVAPAASQSEQVPDEVMERQPLARIKSDARRVRHTPRQDPAESVQGHVLPEGFRGQKATPAQPEVQTGGIAMVVSFAAKSGLGLFGEAALRIGQW